MSARLVTTPELTKNFAGWSLTVGSYDMQGPRADERSPRRLPGNGPTTQRSYPKRWVAGG